MPGESSLVPLSELNVFSCLRSVSDSSRLGASVLTWQPRGAADGASSLLPERGRGREPEPGPVMEVRPGLCRSLSDPKVMAQESLFVVSEPRLQDRHVRWKPKEQASRGRGDGVRGAGLIGWFLRWRHFGLETTLREAGDPACQKR